MKPARPRYSRINRLVGELLSSNGVTSTPVPVDRIARQAGAVVTLYDFDDEVSGVLVRQKDSPAVIGVAKQQSAERQRFTIAHELGHLLLHTGDELHVDKKFRVNLRSPASSRAEDVEEIEANAFAASLLMPMEFLRRDTSAMVVDVEDSAQIEALAEQYEVSVQAITFRLLNVFGKSERV